MIRAQIWPSGPSGDHTGSPLPPDVAQRLDLVRFILVPAGEGTGDQEAQRGMRACPVLGSRRGNLGGLAKQTAIVGATGRTTKAAIAGG